VREHAPRRGKPWLVETATSGRIIAGIERKTKRKNSFPLRTVRGNNANQQAAQKRFQTEYSKALLAVSSIAGKLANSYRWRKL